MSTRPIAVSPYAAAKALRAYPPGILDRTPQRHRLPTMATLAREQYPTPVPTSTIEAFERYHHADVARMDDETIEHERFLARLRRACDPTDEWARERFGRLNAEAARRRAPKTWRGR